MQVMPIPSVCIFIPFSFNNFHNFCFDSSYVAVLTGLFCVAC